MQAVAVALLECFDVDMGACVVSIVKWTTIGRTTGCQLILKCFEIFECWKGAGIMALLLRNKLIIELKLIVQ